MGDFSPKFTRAAKIAAVIAEGSLYARYYDVDYAAVRNLPDSTKGSFAALCSARVPAASSMWYDVAYNGMVLEQSQIITTHNLALLLSVPGFKEDLLLSLPAMAQQCFRWVCKRQQAKSPSRHGKLIMLKQTAYAWRQMVFYLSLLSPCKAADFLVWATAHLETQPAAFRGQFAPALNGLVMIHQGKSWEEAAAANCRRFLGWAKERHWLMDH